jgi:hypothetical protein
MFVAPQSSSELASVETMIMIMHQPRFPYDEFG